MAQNKAIIVGDGGVGKTALVRRFFEEEFERRYIPTVGAEVHDFAGLKVWDFSGQEKFSGIQNYAGARIALIVFSVDQEISYRNVGFWRERIRSQCGEIPILVCANKTDIDESKFPFISDIETSARRDENCAALFRLLQ